MAWGSRINQPFQVLYITVSHADKTNLICTWTVTILDDNIGWFTAETDGPSSVIWTKIEGWATLLCNKTGLIATVKGQFTAGLSWFIKLLELRVADKRRRIFTIYRQHLAHNEL
jgi:hypothetical protein